MEAMTWLNYQHLLYFWTAVREGSVVGAAKALRLSHTTVSEQIHALEQSLGEKLLERTGRRLTPTEMGRVVHRYADEIFTLGRELVDTVEGRATGRAARLRIGIADVLPKLVVRRLLEPALRGREALRIVCYEDTQERLLARLALHEIDVVLADAPAPPGGAVRAYNHLLGTSDVTFFAPPRLWSLRNGFPSSLDGAPMLLPLEGGAVRRALDTWFEAKRVRPQIVAEFEDTALLKVVAQDGLGVFAAPSTTEREIRRQYGVRAIGRTTEIKEHFYAISIERRLKNPAVVAICSAARSDVFGAS
jgi:LysR family transcriptional regulator, transcriptional activator of nhaA